MRPWSIQGVVGQETTRRMWPTPSQAIYGYQQRHHVCHVRCMGHYVTVGSKTWVAGHGDLSPSCQIGPFGGERSRKDLVWRYSFEFKLRIYQVISDVSRGCGVFQAHQYLNIFHFHINQWVLPVGMSRMVRLCEEHGRGKDRTHSGDRMSAAAPLVVDYDLD